MSGKVKHFGRKLTLDNPEFQVVAEDTELLHAGRIVPVYRLTGGPDRGPPAVGDPRGARQGRLRLPGVPAGRGHRRGGGSSPIARAIEEAHYPDSFEGRDAALRRLAFDELLALQLGMVARRRQRVRDAAPQIAIDAPSDAAVRDGARRRDRRDGSARRSS